MRRNVTEYFFMIFHPSVVLLTKPPDPPTEDPAEALIRQSKHLREKQSRLPEYYTWNPDLGKWHMSYEGYKYRTEELGGPMEIAVGRSEEELGDIRFFESLERIYSGETLTLILFVYPDKYDEEIRALFELRVTFW